MPTIQSFWANLKRAASSAPGGRVLNIRCTRHDGRTVMLVTLEHDQVRPLQAQGTFPTCANWLPPNTLFQADVPLENIMAMWETLGE